MLNIVLPTRDNLSFRQAMLADPATMAYNAPWFPPDGCLPFPESDWDEWLDEWTGQEPERFCGFLADASGELVGEISWHGYGAGMGIVILAAHRGKGYGAEGLRLLIDRAFRHPEIISLTNDFEPERRTAMAAHRKLGFVPVGEKDGVCILRLEKARARQALLTRLMDAMCAYEAGCPGRIHHLLKVHGFARQIGLSEGLDDRTRFVLEAAAITHDIGIKPALELTGACPGPLQEKLGPPVAAEMLAKLGFPPEVTERVCFLIGRHHTYTGVEGVDWRILLEADYLVNMVEGNHPDRAIDQARDTFFETAEGKRLIEWVRPR